MGFCSRGAVGSAVFLRQYYKTDAGELAVDRIILALPILGNVQRKAAVARFHPHVGDACIGRCLHPRGFGDYGEDGWEQE